MINKWQNIFTQSIFNETHVCLICPAYEMSSRYSDCCVELETNVFMLFSSNDCAEGCSCHCWEDASNLCGRAFLSFLLRLPQCSFLCVLSISFHGLNENFLIWFNFFSLNSIRITNKKHVSFVRRLSVFFPLPVKVLWNFNSLWPRQIA